MMTTDGRGLGYPAIDSVEPDSHETSPAMTIKSKGMRMLNNLGC